MEKNTMSMSMSMSMSSSYKNLHFDIINHNIIPLLPARSLIRFSSACKTWYYIIKSPQVIATHLNINRSDINHHHQLIVLCENLCYLLVNGTLIQHAELDFSIGSQVYWDNDIVSCNGLILISAKHYDGEYNTFKYWLWNPSIKKIKTLFTVQDDYEEEGYYMYNHELVGLGFHESSNDHRVVRLIYVIDDMTRNIGHVPVEVHVYSLSTDLWHKVDSRPGRLIGFAGGCFLNGVNHWLATTRLTLITWTPEEDYLESILLFDFEDECFKEMVLPEDLQYMIESVCYFNEFKGSLAIVVDDRVWDRLTYFLWVMIDYGVIESWTKKFTIINEESISRRPRALLRIGILIYSAVPKEPNTIDDDDDDVDRSNTFKEKALVHFFDVDSGESRNTFTHWSEPYSMILDFMDSLVMFQG